MGGGRTRRGRGWSSGNFLMFKVTARILASGVLGLFFARHYCAASLVYEADVPIIFASVCLITSYAVCILACIMIWGSGDLAISNLFYFCS